MNAHSKYLNNYRFIFFVLILTGLITYQNAIGNPFVHDDVAFVVENPQINNLGLSALKEIFFPRSLKASLVQNYYRPLLEVMYRLLFKIFGFDARGFHFFNIAVHCANSFLVFLLVRRIIPQHKWGSLGIAAIFLVHPLQTESVTYFAGISDLMFSFFVLSSLWFYLKFSADHGNKRFRYYIFSLTLFIVALSAKEHAIILPFLILLYEFCFCESSKKLKSIFVKVSGHGGVLVCYFWFRRLVFGKALAISLGPTAEIILRLKSIPQVLLEYFGVIFFPFHLHFYRTHNILDPAMAPAIIFAAVSGTLFFLLCALPLPERRAALFGLGVFSISILPTLNIIPLILEYSYIFTAEHFLYFPLTGFLLMIFLVVQNFMKNFSVSISPPAIIAVACIFLMGLTIRQNLFYRSEVALFERSARYEPHLSRVQLVLANAYFHQARFDDAVTASQKAVEILEGYIHEAQPEFVKRHYRGLIRQNYLNMVASFTRMGKKEEAEKFHQMARDLE